MLLEGRGQSERGKIVKGENRKIIKRKEIRSARRGEGRIRICIKFSSNKYEYICICARL